MAAAEANVRLQDSHDRRSQFQLAIYIVALAIVLAFGLVLVIGVALPPPALDTRAADWGLAIVAKSATASPVLLTVFGFLGSLLGMSYARGAHDAKLGKDGET